MIEVRAGREIPLVVLVIAQYHNVVLCKINQIKAVDRIGMC